MDEIMPQHQPSLISEFYRDRCIFITGATGFLGKVLVEKLLRSCPKIKAIYVLMRAKKDQDIRDRMDQEFLKNVVSIIIIIYYYCIILKNEFHILDVRSTDSRAT